MSSTTSRAVAGPTMLNKVPEITVFFWIIKVLCTSVGESAADYINETLGFGLGPTTALMTALLVAALVVQFRTRAYVPWVYWLSVVLISVVGTLATDNLTDGLGISLLVTAPVFAVLLAGIFLWWYRTEGTLSIHSIVTTRREAFYWLVVLVTFALGTAVGDLLVDRLSMSLLGAVVVFAVALALVVVAWRTRLVAPLTAFWVAYVLTRPLGGSTGDYLSGDRSDGGAGFGTLLTSLVFLAAIIATVAYLSVTGRDRTPVERRDGTATAV
ncbi:COG4705 family protein [Motilibacter rhizosphaerae]|nr:hypothetical protein [Motilibacter rhizosphaerae]